MADEQIDLLAELTAYNIEARYGDYKESLSEVIGIEKAKILFEQTQELSQWIASPMHVEVYFTTLCQVQGAPCHAGHACQTL